MPSSPNLYAYIHSEIVPLENAFLHVSDLSIQRGYGVFEYCKVQDGEPLFLDNYLNRFYNSAQQLELRLPLDKEALTDVIYQLIRKNEVAATAVSGIKMVLTGGYSAGGYEPGEPNLLIIQQPLNLPGKAMLENGIKIITHEYVREIPSAKTINYTMGILQLNRMKAAGADDVLYQREGVITEFPRCNFFIVKQDNTVVTPDRNVLSGITRKNVLSLAGKKYKAEEAVVTMEDVAQAKEAFLTSTTKRIVPIVQVNDTVIGDGKPGAVTMELLNDLIALEQEYIQQTAVR